MTEPYCPKCKVEATETRGLESCQECGVGEVEVTWWRPKCACDAGVMMPDVSEEITVYRPEHSPLGVLTKETK